MNKLIQHIQKQIENKRIALEEDLSVQSENLLESDIEVYESILRFIEKTYPSSWHQQEALTKEKTPTPKPNVTPGARHFNINRH